MSVANAAATEEQRLKKKLQTFHSELLRVGTVKGFKYFAMYMRGREEMMISVLNEPQGVDNSYVTDTSLFNFDTVTPSPTDSLTAASLPYDKRSLMLSRRTQLKLSGLGDKGIGLPPASPSDNEMASQMENSTLFLLAGYGRYNCPYVWVRSNHERLVRMSREDIYDKDSPLRLRSTSNAKWKNEEIHVWEIIRELVKLCTAPPPRNPFEVDFEYYDHLPLQERITNSAATISLLQEIVATDVADRSYTAKVLEDLHLLTKIHLQDLRTLIHEQRQPSQLQQQQSQQQQLQQSQQQQQHQLQQQQWQQAQQSYSLPGYIQQSQTQYGYRYQTGMM
ncbi:uncharacterized protein LOC106179179 [Lingula anatina]|uniref:Uncharacterized protein LOC106179179 n=1 Tax=Lingula anatina TaxID=7574 RepID=A0A1S3K6N8_LINAN|nr:uncharacterized protein LOC106179179 [Lingula anatina]XP_013418168.1 uncharacterized protein LOC106179179 [Lingula anatina]|eukprot:XP_013418167.1 uncharacterized protein LOC106179179 [Lingula anatina]